jgi:hypothetical protein
MEWLVKGDLDRLGKVVFVSYYTGIWRTWGKPRNTSVWIANVPTVVRYRIQVKVLLLELTCWKRTQGVSRSRPLFHYTAWFMETTEILHSHYCWFLYTFLPLRQICCISVPDTTVYEHVGTCSIVVQQWWVLLLILIDSIGSCLASGEPFVYEKLPSNCSPLSTLQTGVMWILVRTWRIGASQCNNWISPTFLTFRRLMSTIVDVPHR